MKLAIISHTGHYTSEDGNIVGWGPTVSEINHLAPHFEKIYHIAFLHPGEAKPSSIAYKHSNIEFVPLRPSGGKTIFSKLDILWKMPTTISKVRRALKKVDAFQLRTPIGMAVYLIPWLSLCVKKKGWYKYAGNWKQENAPLGYTLQRWMLKKQSRKVTINGAWENQPEHCFTFENPCLTLDERKEGLEVIAEKEYNSKFSFCFVGRLDDEKGVQRIIDGFAQVSNKNQLEAIHFIGNGEKMNSYKNQCQSLGIPAHFYGFMTRDKVFDVYRKCQFLLLPSTASEGFPKVIAEGMNFGCIPIVSSVSSIGQYIGKQNGYLVEPATSAVLGEILNAIFSEEKEILKTKASNGYKVAESFTFVHYNNRILNDILKIN